MGICACNNKASDVPHSELFVPRFDVTVDKVHQKKLLRLKSLALNKSEVIPLKTVSTEKYIYSKELIKPGAITKNTTFNPDISMLNKLHFLQTDKAPIINIVSRHSSYRENMPNFKLEPPKVKQEDKHCSVIVPSPPKEIFEKKESAENNNIQCEISEQIFSNTEEIFIANVLLRHYLFNQVTQEQISSLISEINEYQIEENNYLFYEEEKASCVYIIKSGKVELSNKNSNKTIVLSQGSVFGEIALFSDTSLRQYSAKSITKVELFLIDNNTVAPFLSGMKIKPTFHFHLFDYLDTSIRDKLAFFSSGIDCLKGKFISELNGILGIESGELSVYEIKTNKEIEVYRKGDIIGMKKLLLNPDDCTSVIKTNYQFGNNVRIVAKENTKCSLIPILTFVEILGLEYSFKILFGVFNTIMVKNFFFLNMSSSNDGSELKKLYPLFELKEYTKNDIIYNKEAYKTNKTIQIIIEGSASYIYNDTNKGNVNDNGKQSIKVGCIIGEECVSGIRLFSDIKVKTEKMLLLESSWNECKENINVLNSTLTKFIKRMNDMFLFSRLPEWKIIKLYKHCEYKTYNNGDKIIALNKKIDKVFFIKSGSVKYKVDKKTIAKRACFLCEKNRPEQQIKLTAFGGKFQVLVNPFPILKGHLTIPATAHTMQSIKGCYGNLCEIANALSGYVVFYNGPKCGASAPDHLHFQAGKRGDMPIEKYWKSYESTLQPVFTDSLFKLKGYACPALVIVARNIEESVSVFDKLYARLQQNGEEEFPINVLAWKEGDNIVTVIFLRKKHRPDCYFAEEEEQMIISPGSVDMGGLIITAREKDFKNITQQKAFDILKEVSLTEEEIDEILK